MQTSFSSGLRILSEILASPIAQFSNDIMRTKTVPPGFAFANTILLYKNGDPTSVTNHRPISLLSTLCKVLTKVFTRRLRNTIEERLTLPPEQAGFGKNFSTVDHMHALSTVAEKCHEFNIQLCAAFVDFKKAFDCVELPMLWQPLESFGVDPNMIKTVQLLYANSSAAVRVGNQLAKFELQRGVRQGDSMSPSLCTIVLRYALNSIDWRGKSLKLGTKTLSYLVYADDIVLLAHNHEDLESMTEMLYLAAAQMGLQINFIRNENEVDEAG
ncbi:reverse transcriptase [Ancylostoma duodenale]|uniref:Reverse transcriptase n=1 Tax=Ancylostoma duodenale TaxID=51022 RepID=A0A0C2FJW5_9BILA|nr:reverse transcriptase [Ancylostoma duodenale]